MCVAFVAERLLPLRDPGLREEGGDVRTRILAVAAAILLAGGLAQSREHEYQKGVLAEMQSAPCGYAEKSAKTVGGVLLGTDSAHKKTQEMLCQEYILQTDQLMYRIRPKDDKHPTLLPVGETAEFRIHKDKMLLRMPEGDSKEREYIVVSMVPRADVEGPKPAAKNSPK